MKPETVPTWMYRRGGESRLVTTFEALEALDDDEWADTPAAFYDPKPEPEPQPRPRTSRAPRATEG